MSRKRISFAITTALYALSAIVLFCVLYKSGTYTDGENTMFHLYRADSLLDSWKNGSPFLWYDSSIYNGTELLRYFGILPVYFMAIIECITSDVAITYSLLTVIVFFLSAETIYYISLKQNNSSTVISFFIGLIWFFFPSNLYIWFTEGNIPAGIALVMIIPILYYNVKMYLKKGTKKNWIFCAVWMAVLALTEEIYAVMFLILLSILLMVLSFMGKTHRRGLLSLSGCLIGLGIAGFWFVPAVTGNIHYNVVSESYANNFQSLLTSLNSIERIKNGNTYLYTGITACVLALFQLLFGKRETKGSAFTYLIVLVLSSTAFYNVIRHLYLASFFQMLYICAMACSVLIVDFIGWITLRKWIYGLFAVLLAADSIPSLPVIYQNLSGVSADERMDMEETYTWIKDAQSYSNNRIAVMDNGTLSSMGNWLVTRNRNKNIYGSGWTSSSTQQNTRMLNQSLEDGHYLYMFDRLYSYGTDSVVIRVDQMQTGDKEDIEKLDEAGSRIGYSCVKENQDYRLYELNTDDTYGTVTTYQYLAIGSDSENICETFPSFRLADDSNLSDYTFDDLKAYKVIYLTGFTYDDKDEAEELIEKLSENGVRIIISADGIPKDRTTHDQNFLGLQCQPIQFKYGFPEMETVDGTFDTELFPFEYQKWETVYINGLDNVLGSVQTDNSTLPFFGTVKNDNIYVIGFRLSQFYGLTGDEKTGELLSKAFDVSSGDIPERHTVRLSVNENVHGIEIQSNEKDTMTGYAYVPCMKIEGDYEVVNHLIVMKGTNLKITYHLSNMQIIGVILSCFSIILLMYLSKRANVEGGSYE